MAGKASIEAGEKRRDEIQQFVRDYWASNHIGPALDEVAEHLQMSRTAVRHHVHRMITEGRLARSEGKYRSLRLLEADEG